MQALLAHGGDPKLATNDNVTPLMVASGVGRREGRSREEQKRAVEAVKLLLDLGVDVNAASNTVPSVGPRHQVSHNSGLTALHGAAFMGEDEIVQLLVGKGATVNAMDWFGATPLALAEGDPNRLIADYGEPLRVHPSTANLLRKLGASTSSKLEPIRAN